MADHAFTGKVVVIAGNGGEVGLVLGRAFAEAGSQVVIAAPQRAIDATLISSLQNEGLAVLCEEVDVRDPLQSSDLIERLADRYGHVDVLINTLALPEAGPFTDKLQGAAESLSSSEWEQGVTTVLTTSFTCVQAAGRQMLKQGHGVIANLTSVHGLKVVEGHVAAAILHTALVGMTKALGVEWAGRGVRVVGIALPLSFGEPSRRTPLREGVSAQQIAETLVYLTSDEAAYITAETIALDGGWTAYQLF